MRTRLGRAVLERLLCALDEREREVVEGDLHELDLWGTDAVREVLGLVVRRQLDAWRTLSPWIALLVLAAPLAVVFGVLSRQWAANAAVVSWFYIDNWTPAYLASPAARGDLIDAVTAGLVESAALILWAWSAGCALALLSRRTASPTLALFAFVLFTATIGTTTSAAHNPANAAVFLQPRYSLGLPLAFPVLLVLLPALCGVRRGARAPALAAVQSWVLAAAVVAVSVLAARASALAVFFGWLSRATERPVLAFMSQTGHDPVLRLVPIVMTLPALFVLWQAAASRHRRDEG